MSVVAPPLDDNCLLSGFLAVPVDMLRRLDSAVVDLFVQPEPDDTPVLYQHAGGPLDADHIGRLDELGVQRVFVRFDDFQHFGADLLN